MEDLLKFVRFTHEFRGVIRHLWMVNEGRNENDAEHSCQLALVAWFLVSTQNINLNTERVLKYALAHDLVEAYAGDTPAVGKGFEKEQASKHDRELAAIKKLKEEFPLHGDLHGIIASYESREDEEAKFVYALDKILPVMNIYLDGGAHWKMSKVGLEDILENKTSKVSISEDVKRYFDLLAGLLESEQDTLFFKDEQKSAK